jgi:hypothetical protein
MLAPIALPKPLVPDRNVRLGVLLAMSIMLDALRCSSASPLNAVTAIGVSCKFCDRNCAVTMIIGVDCASGVCVSAELSALCANAGAPILHEIRAVVTVKIVFNLALLIDFIESSQILFLALSIYLKFF